MTRKPGIYSPLYRENDDNAGYFSLVAIQILVLGIVLAVVADKLGIFF